MSKVVSHDPSVLPTMEVELKARLVSEDFNNGTVVVSVKVRPLTEDESDLLDHLFPNTQEALGRLLRTEAILAALK